MGRETCVGVANLWGLVTSSMAGNHSKRGQRLRRWKPRWARRTGRHRQPLRSNCRLARPRWMRQLGHRPAKPAVSTAAQGTAGHGRARQLGLFLPHSIINLGLLPLIKAKPPSSLRLQQPSYQFKPRHSPCHQNSSHSPPSWLRGPRQPSCSSWRGGS